jgi:DNA-binding transcriptional LysR family regulator
MDVSLTGLRVLREIAERGSFSAAATALGYTQSAVSRQVAGLEQAARAQLFQRRRGGVELTPAGRTLLRYAAVILEELDSAERALSGAPPTDGRVRLGAFASAGAVLLPRALAALRHSHPKLTVTTREAGTPALVRAVRAGTLDLALFALAPPFRAPDVDAPALVLETLSEHSLLVAVPADHELAAQDSVRLAQLHGQRWITSPKAGDETPLGAWPGLDARPRVVHVTRDWLTKLNLVAAGLGFTTIPALLLPVLPAGVRALPVEDGPAEARRLVLGRRSGAVPPAVDAVTAALRSAVS